MSQLKTRFITDAAVTAAKLASDSVTTVKILDANVTLAKLAANSVDSSKIVDGSIVAADLASDSVTTVKILDANVTAAKLASDSVTTVKILDANVTAAKLASDSVTTVKILDANVTLAKLAANSVDSSKIVDGSIVAADLASDSVTTAKILDANVTFAKLASGVPASVLATKFMAALDFVSAFTTGASATSDDVSTPVLAAALTATPITALTSLGIYTGAVSGATDPLRVLIRKAGTDEAFNDGLGDDVYGVLTESSGVYTLSYKKSDGTAYTFVLATSIDFFFIENYNLSTLPVTALLKEGIGGVIISGGTVQQATETYTLNGTDITNKYVTLSHVPAIAGNVNLKVDGEGEQLYGIDYTMGTSVRLSWSGLGLDGVLASGDILQAQYLY